MSSLVGERVWLVGASSGIGAALAEEVGAALGRIDTVVWCAGYWQTFTATDWQAEQFARHVEINLLESMRASLSTKGVRVTTVCPGFVRTEMTATNSFPMPFIIDAEEAATDIADGLEDGKIEIVFPRRMAVMMKVAAVLPVRLWAAITARLARSSPAG